MAEYLMPLDNIQDDDQLARRISNTSKYLSYAFVFGKTFSSNLCFSSSKIKTRPMHFSSGHQTSSRPMSSTVPLTSTSHPRLLPSATFIPAIPLPAPPVVSGRHPSSSSSPMPIQQQPTSVYRSQVSSPNPMIDQMVPYQQAPPSTASTATSSVSQQQQQRVPGFLSNHPSPRIPIPSAALSSSLAPLPTPSTVLASRSENCPECRAITSVE